jgi:(3S)-malyl-CoA thioesterase
MTHAARPLRSVLYIPGSKDRALDKAQGLAADAIIFDLEDAVAPTEKVAARQTLLQALTQGGYGSRVKLVRVNALDTEWGRDDIAAFKASDIDGILLPKVDGPEDFDAVLELAPDVQLWAMIETSRGVLRALDIADHPAMRGFIMGTNDLAKELGCTVGPDRAALLTSLQIPLLAARGAGIACVDGVYNAFKDVEGLEAECIQGRDFGFDGKTLIHPAQLETANRVFSPSPDMLNLAARQIEAFEKAEAEGLGVAVVDGRIVENLHVVTARALLARAQAIADLEASQ